MAKKKSDEQPDYLRQQHMWDKMPIDKKETHHFDNVPVWARVLIVVVSLCASLFWITVLINYLFT